MGADDCLRKRFDAAIQKMLLKGQTEVQIAFFLGVAVGLQKQGADISDDYIDKTMCTLLGRLREISSLGGFISVCKN